LGGSDSSSRRVAAIALATLLAALASRGVFRVLPPPASTLAWKAGWLVLCVVGLRLAHGLGLRRALAELGVSGSMRRGLGVALVASLPMLGILYALSPASPRLVPWTLFVGSLFAALTEETLFRGYAFRQLYRRAGWRFTNAVVASALVFGLAHVWTVTSAPASELLGVVGITAVGGAFFAWLFVRWQDNLWVPIGMHMFMNMWWDVFNVSANAIGDGVANGARLAAVASAILMTLLLTSGVDGTDGAR